MKGRLVWIISLVLLGCAWQSDARSDTVWLVIGASGKSLVSLIEAKQRLIRDWPQATIMVTDDCVNVKPGFFVLAAEVASSKVQAQQAVTKLRQLVPDAYLKQCDILDKSRLAMRIPLVDSSIEKVPADAVNWGDEDRVTELILLNNTDFLIVQRVFDPGDTGFREGRQQKILFFRDDPNKSILLNSDCWDFGGLYYHYPFLAFHCADQVAGDYLIHKCEVHRLEPPGKIFQKLYCRNPVLLGDKRLRCEEEAVDAEGELSLTTVEQRLPTPVRLRRGCP